MKEANLKFGGTGIANSVNFLEQEVGLTHNHRVTRSIGFHVGQISEASAATKPSPAIAIARLKFDIKRAYIYI